MPKKHPKSLKKILFTTFCANMDIKIYVQYLLLVFNLQLSASQLKLFFSQFSLSQAKGKSSTATCHSQKL